MGEKIPSTISRRSMAIMDMVVNKKSSQCLPKENHKNTIGLSPKTDNNKPDSLLLENVPDELLYTSLKDLDTSIFDKSDLFDSEKNDSIQENTDDTLFEENEIMTNIDSELSKQNKGIDFIEYTVGFDEEKENKRDDIRQTFNNLKDATQKMHKEAQTAVEECGKENKFELFDKGNPNEKGRAEEMVINTRSDIDESSDDGTDNDINSALSANDESLDINVNDETGMELSANDESSPENSNLESSGSEIDFFAVKQGTLKRKSYLHAKEERMKIMKAEKLERHNVKGKCKCVRKCGKQFSDDIRLRINKKFWNLNYDGRKSFISSCTEEVFIKRRRKSTGPNHRKRKSYNYYLKNADKKKVQVCQKMFYGTLGFKANNGSLHKFISPTMDKRGKHENHKKIINMQAIMDHIVSFSPSISHYRREHAPKKLYLPSDLSITAMHKSFLAIYGSKACSYYAYRDVVTEKLNISFTHLGHEECEKCTENDIHKKSHSVEQSETCQNCIEFNNHIEKAKEARRNYKLSEQNSNNEELHITVDLQKIIMLPRIDMFKEAIFTPRLIAFNESFVPVGKFSEKRPPFAALWHEGVAGRKKEDIVSTYHAFFTEYARDYKNIIVWCDNCTAQNKNWCIFSYLIYLINSNEISADKISFRYFETGHTFMAADSFHHLVEKKLREKKYVYDFKDFCDCVQFCSNATPVVKIMTYQDFRKWPVIISTYQIQKMNKNTTLIKDMKEVTVKKGSKNLFFKKLLDGPEYSIVCVAKKYMNANFVIQKPLSVEGDKGISRERKEKIIKNLLKLMPEHKRQFWLDLKINDNKNDFIDSDED